MLERKLITVESSLIQRKSAVRQRVLDDYSYAKRLIGVCSYGYGLCKESELVYQTMQQFLGCTEAVIERLSGELPAKPAEFPALANYALHLSALFNREALLPPLQGKKLLRGEYKLCLDPAGYPTVIPDLVKYNLNLLENNKRRDILQVQESFFSMVIDATYHNGQSAECSSFNDKIRSFSVSVRNGAVHVFEGYVNPDAPDGEDRIPLFTHESAHEPKQIIHSPARSRIESRASPPLPTRFDDIAGYTELKKRFQRLKDVLTKDNVYTRAGVPLPTGFLLYGPPGTGKSTLVYAFANECGWPFREMNVQDALNKYIGETEKKLSAFLRQKGILLLDEFDSLGKSKDKFRSDNTGFIINITNTIATELNRYDPERILFAITNNIDLIDSKLKSRRLGNVIFVDYPIEQDCAEILCRKLEAAERKSEGYIYTNVDYRDIAHTMMEHARGFTERYGNRCPVGFSGADIENIVNDVLRERAEAMLYGRAMVAPTTEDYVAAVRQFDFKVRQT